MKKTKIVVSETKKRLIDDIHYLLKEVDNDIVSKNKDIDNSVLIASILEEAPEKSVLDLVVTKEYLKDFLKSINASVIISEDTMPKDDVDDLENVFDTPEDMEMEANKDNEDNLMGEFENVKTKAQELISRIENSEDEVPDIADTSKLVSISVAIQEKIDELNNLDVSDNSFAQKFEELKQFITSKESEVIEILGGGDANELNDLINDEEDVTTEIKKEPGDEDVVTSDVKTEPGDEDPVTCKEKPKCEDDVILGIGMGDEEFDDLTDEDLENLNEDTEIEPLEPEEETPLDDVKEPVTSEMVPSNETSLTNDEEPKISVQDTVEIPLDPEKAKTVVDLIKDMEKELNKYLTDINTVTDEKERMEKSDVVNSLYNKLDMLKNMINYEPTPDDVVADIDESIKDLGNIMGTEGTDTINNTYEQLKDNLLTSLDGIANECDNCEDPASKELPEVETSVSNVIDYDNFDGKNFEETELEDGDSEQFFNDDVEDPEASVHMEMDIDSTPNKEELDFTVEDTPEQDPFLDMDNETNSEDANVEEILAPKKKYKPKFKKVK